MNTSEKLDQLAPALVAAQAKWPRFVKSARADAGSYGYNYIPLDELMKGIGSAFEHVGLGVIQEAVSHGPTASTPAEVGVLTRVIHISGQWIEYDALYLPAGNTAQTAGSALSYARRYALMAALGIAAEDDDGAAASKHSPPAASGTASTRSAPAGDPSKITTGQGGDNVGANRATGPAVAPTSVAGGEAANGEGVAEPPATKLDPKECLHVNTSPLLPSGRAITKADRAWCLDCQTMVETEAA